MLRHLAANSVPRLIAPSRVLRYMMMVYKLRRIISLKRRVSDIIFRFVAAADTQEDKRGYFFVPCHRSILRPPPDTSS